MQIEISELENDIQHYRNAYQKGEPEITDSEYDILLEQLRKIDPNNELLIKVEKSLTLDGEKVSHSISMLSLEKKYSYTDVISWIKKVSRPNGERFKIEPKYDGVSGKYYFESKTLSTRGDGNEGENISLKLPLIELISPRFRNWDEIDEDLLGEIIITHPNFKKCTYTKKNGDKYKTPRNLTAGILNLKDINECIGKIQLSFIDYELESLSLKAIDITENIFSNIVNKIKDCDYPTDGVVFKIEDEVYGESLGVTEHHPRCAIAYKPEDLGVETILEKVVLQHGKNKLTPVAIIKPVIINGVEIKRATLHNAKFLLDNGVTIGDKLEIIRSNDVIPYVQNVERGEYSQQLFFNKCDVCDSPLEYREPELYCTNKNCEGNLVKKLTDSVKFLGIDELGSPTIEKMIDQLGVSDILDILDLTKKDLLLLEGFAETSATNLYGNILKVRSNPIYDYQLLSALNIPGISKGLCKKLCESYSLNEITKVPMENIIALDNFGYERASNIVDHLDEHSNILDGLLKIFSVLSTKKDPNAKVLQKICFSGSFDRPKEHYKQIAKQKGFEVVDSVTKELKYLITAGTATDKVSKARKYNIQILDIKEFLKL